MGKARSGRPATAGGGEEAKRLEYIGLAQLLDTTWEDNPKAHDLGAIHLSINRHGFRGALLFDERTGRLVAGHGRLETLRQKKHEFGEEPPRGIVERDGEWYVPVIRGESFETELEATEYTIADNKLVIAGGWLEDLLVESLQEVREETGTLDGTGFTDEELEQLLKDLQGEPPKPPADPGAGDERNPSDTQVQIGAYRFPVERAVYERWLEDVRDEAGFEDDAIKDEIRRRLKL